VVGAAVVFFFPRHDREQQLLAEYDDEDQELRPAS
jgi:hypothetical protein